MRLAIVGSRNCGSINISEHIAEMPECIISGGAKGVDTLAAQYAREHGIELVEYLPQYNLYGKGAPLKRNEQIVAASDKVLAFWDGASRGTLNSINHARRIGKQVQIVRI